MEPLQSDLLSMLIETFAALHLPLIHSCASPQRVLVIPADDASVGPQDGGGEVVVDGEGVVHLRGPVAQPEVMEEEGDTHPGWGLR